MAVLLFALCGCTFSGGADGKGTPKTLTLSPSSVELWVGETYRLRASASEEDEVLTWTSDDERVATVEDGLVTALSAGQAVVTVSCSYASESCEIAVLGAPAVQGETVTLSETAITLSVGAMYLLTATASDGSAVAWRTEDAGIATVEGGLVYAAGFGTTRIVAESPTAQAAYCTVTVTGTSRTVQVIPERAELTVGEEQALSAMTSDGSAVKWSSENSAVARVDGDGTVFAVGAGQTRIFATSRTAGSAYCTVTVTEAYRKVWGDEFDGTELSADWEYQEGIRDIYHGHDTQNWNWGNNELQYYTRDAVSLQDGALVITAKREAREGMEYTSARIATRDRRYFTYGYFEARMRLPLGNGMWPAFWMLPQPADFSSTRNKYGGWPASGEIDIMEARGRLPYNVGTTLHFGPATEGTWQSRYLSRDHSLSSSIAEWHTYGLEWTSDSMIFYIDRIAKHVIKSYEWFSRSAMDDPDAPFDTDFYILFDLAVGGNFDGGIGPEDSFTSASMAVDYVRVYQK